MSARTTQSTQARPRFVRGGDPTQDYRRCGRILCGPGINEPDARRGSGYYGNLFWPTLLRLRSGELWVSFHAGYWHVSAPTPIRVEKKALREWQRQGFPTKGIHAPTGGRYVLIKSKDGGATWTKPTTLWRAPNRHPHFVELADGTLLGGISPPAGWYGYSRAPVGLPRMWVKSCVIRSHDGGATWSDPTDLPSPFNYEEIMGMGFLCLSSGRILLPTYGRGRRDELGRVAVYASDDNGASWELLAVLANPDHSLFEPTVAQAPDGRVLMLARGQGDIAFSSDEGQTWTQPEPFGIRMQAPQLLTLRDGTLLCIFDTPGIGAVFSRDGGRTWICPAEEPGRGFMIDPTAFGHPWAVELPDGSVYVVYYDGFYQGRFDQRRTAIRAIRMRVRDDASGIDLLPVPGCDGETLPDGPLDVQCALTNVADALRVSMSLSNLADTAVSGRLVASSTCADLKLKKDARSISRIPVDQARRLDLPLVMSGQAPEIHAPIHIRVETNRGRLESRRDMYIAKCLRSDAPIVIDGRLDEWRRTGVIRIARREQVQDAPYYYHDRQVDDPASLWGGRSDLSAEARARWDDSYLYLGIRVWDDKLVTRDDLRKAYLGDSVEVFLSTHGRDEETPGRAAVKSCQICFRPASGKRRPDAWFVAPGSDLGIESDAIRMASSRTSDGYLMEIALPFSDAFRGEAGRIVGFDLAVNDADDSHGRKLQMVWAGARRKGRPAPVTGNLLFVG